jgi:metal-responsive CopG/Arc/MetJ family transcriptional regulator
MKIAVSMPDDLFQQAEAAARRLRVSRSELYATAIAEFLKQQDTRSITIANCPAALHAHNFPMGQPPSNGLY